jgi:hypothetical protein
MKFDKEMFPFIKVMATCDFQRRSIPENGLLTLPFLFLPTGRICSPKGGKLVADTK